MEPDCEICGRPWTHCTCRQEDDDEEVEDWGAGEADDDQ